MITKRNKRLAEIQAEIEDVRSGRLETLMICDVQWLLDEIERLDKKLERIHDDAVQDAIECDLNT